MLFCGFVLGFLQPIVFKYKVGFSEKALPNRMEEYSVSIYSSENRKVICDFDIKVFAIKVVSF
jgi:hypothetical protein